MNPNQTSEPSLMRLSKSLLGWLKRVYPAQVARIHPAPVFVLGNQKGGTTAIAALLGLATGIEVTHDFLFRLPESRITRLLLEGQDLKEFIRQNRLEFSRQLIKDNSLTFFHDALLQIYPASRFVLVVRDPRDNIRSILNRLELPGDVEDLSHEEKNNPNFNLLWRLLLSGEWPPVDGRGYIESLSSRWNLAADAFDPSQSNFFLCRYEDFREAKADVIEALARKVGLEVRADISDAVDRQYQHKGDRRVDWIDFFGPENLEKIERICGERMKTFGYSLVSR